MHGHYIYYIEGIGLLTIYTFCYSPIKSYWDLTLNPRDCFNEAPSLIAHATITAILDLFVWVLPLPTLYHTKLPLSQRLALITLFSFGLVVVFAGCICIYWVYYVVHETYDVTWYGFHLWLWTAVEVQLGLICGCVPWLKSLFKFWKTGQTVTDTSGRAPSDWQQTMGSKRVTVVRMDSLGKAWTGEGPGKGKYIDLERSAASGSHTQLRFSSTSKGSPTIYISMERGQEE